MPFKFSGEDYEDSSLERLIHVFNKLTDNERLVDDLAAFKKERNFLSHRGIAHCLDYEGDIFESTATEYQSRLEAMRDEALRLQRAVHDEANKILVELHYGDLPNAS